MAPTGDFTTRTPWYERVLTWKLTVSWKGRESDATTTSDWDGSGTALLRGSGGEWTGSGQARLHAKFDFHNEVLPAHLEGSGKGKLQVQLQSDGSRYTLFAPGLGSVDAHGWRIGDAVFRRRENWDSSMLVQLPDFGKAAEMGQELTFPDEPGAVSGSFAFGDLESATWTLEPMTIEEDRGDQPAAKKPAAPRPRAKPKPRAKRKPRPRRNPRAQPARHPMRAPTGSAADLARQILGNGRITRSDAHASGQRDHAHPTDQLNQTAAGHPAERSHYGTAPGGTVPLDPGVLQAMQDLSEHFSFRVSEIAGASHSAGSTHYDGTAFDVDMINGVAVSASNPYYRDFMREAVDLGAVLVIGPGQPGHATHVHVTMPRAPLPRQSARVEEMSLATAFEEPAIDREEEPISAVYVVDSGDSESLHYREDCPALQAAIDWHAEAVMPTQDEVGPAMARDLIPCGTCLRMRGESTWIYSTDSMVQRLDVWSDRVEYLSKGFLLTSDRNEVIPFPDISAVGPKDGLIFTSPRLRITHTDGEQLEVEFGSPEERDEALDVLLGAWADAVGTAAG